MAKIYFHVDVHSAFLSWAALKALQDGGTVDLRTIPAVVGGDETKRHGVVLAKRPRQAVRHQNGGEPVRGPHQMPGADGRAAGF